MELAQLKYFMEVAQSQHVTRSAEKLHIAQPALTKAIHRLEKELDVPLFVSRGRNIVLTEYGRYLMSKLSSVIATIDMLPHDLRIMAEAENSTIHMNVSAASALVTESIIQYKERRRVNFRLAQGSDPDICDINVYTKPWFNGEISENLKAFTEQIFLAVPDNDTYSGLKSVRLADVKDEEFICLAGIREFRSICDKFCDQAGFSPKIGFESDNPTAVQNLVAAGFGVGFWPEHSWGRFHPRGAKLLPVSDIACSRAIVISCNFNKKDNSAVRDYFDFLLSFFENKNEGDK